MRILFTGVALIGMAASAVAADIPAPIEQMPEAIAAPVFTWTGFYVGVHAGAAWNDNGDDIDCESFTNIIEDGVPDEAVADCEGPFDIADPLSPNFPGPVEAFDLADDFIAVIGGGGGDDDIGVLGGGQVGANWQMGMFVLGVEADVSAVIDGDDGDDEEAVFEFFSAGLDPLDDFVGEGFVTSEAEIDWLSTLRARLGVALGSEGRFLIYGTGGVAFAGINSSLSGRFEDDPAGDVCSGCFFGEADDQDGTEVGWTAGIGGEWAATNRVSIGLEYLFVSFDEQDRSITFFGDDAGGGPGSSQFDIEDSVDFDQNIIRAKVNVKLGG